MAGLLLIAHIWDLDLVALTEARMGGRVARAVVDSALIVLLAYLVWQIAKTAIDSRLASAASSMAVNDAGEAGGTGASRLRTLLPLVRGFLFATICTMTVMTILAALGVNIGPLLAGAGVVGLALGSRRSRVHASRPAEVRCGPVGSGSHLGWIPVLAQNRG